MKTTNDLMRVLNTIDDDIVLNSYLASIDKYKDLNYLEYYLAVMNDHGVSKNNIVKESGINRTYCYQMLSGGRKPGRDNAIVLCLAAHFTLAETITFMELLEIAPLYPKDTRDSIIIYSINREYSVYKTNELLFSKNEATLGD